MQRRNKFTLAGAMLALAFQGAAAPAALYNAAPSVTIYFNGVDESDGIYSNGLAMTGPAAIGQAGDYWNKISGINSRSLAGGTIDLNDAANNPSTVKLTLPTAQATPDAQQRALAFVNLGDTFTHNTISHQFDFGSTASTDTYTFSGLDVSATYNLYVYSLPVTTKTTIENGVADGDNRGFQVSVNGGAISTLETLSTPDGTFSSVEGVNWLYGASSSDFKVMGGNYIKLSDLHPDADGKLAASFNVNNVAGAVPQSYFDITGFQLESVPEPTSLGLISVVGLTLLRRRHMH